MHAQIFQILNIGVSKCFSWNLDGNFKNIFIKLQACYEHIKKIQSEFPRVKILPRSGIHTHTHTRTHTPVSIYFYQANNRNTTTVCEIFSKLTIKTPEQRYYQLSVTHYN